MIYISKYVRRRLLYVTELDTMAMHREFGIWKNPDHPNTTVPFLGLSSTGSHWYVTGPRVR